MTTKEKREYIILAVILVALLGFVYMNFFHKSQPAATAEQTAAMNGALPGSMPAPAGALPNGVPSAGPIPGSLAPGSNAAPAASSGQFLPHGTELNFKVLQDPRFQTLIVPVYPTVDPSEVGMPNPFGAAGNSGAASGTGTSSTNAGSINSAATNTKK
jgi:hypothetical protein